VRGALGTENRGVALRLVHRIELALSEGPRSKLWAELRGLIPYPTFARFTKFAGVEGKLILVWKEFRDLFESYKRQQLKMNELSDQTFENYQRSLDSFEAFLAEHRIKMVQDVDKTTIDNYSLWRIDEVKRPQSTGGGPSLRFDLRHLHHAFEFARERGLIEKNPVSVPASRSDRHIARPFSADEIVKWEDEATAGPVDQLFPDLSSSNDEWVPFWLLRWTGLRPRDAIDLSWQEVSLDRRVIERLCHKNNKRVSIPILEDENLLVALDAERKRRNPLPSEPVLLHPATGRAFTYPQLWALIVDLGKRAGIPDASPYRFRGTFAVEMLLRSNNPYYVANLLGDTMAIVERHYMPYVRELREHSRLILEGGVGLRGFVTPVSQQKNRSY
jgi:site-specific recombinase XerD